MLDVGWLENNSIQALIRDYEMRGWPESQWHVVGQRLSLHLYKTETHRIAAVHRRYLNGTKSDENNVLYAEEL